MMTLPDNVDCTSEQTCGRPVDIGAVLKNMLVKALENGQLTSGVFASAKLLNSNPENVSVCVLPDVNPQEDVTIHIQHKLIEAYCWENDIPVIMVSGLDKLACLAKTSLENNNHFPEIDDLSCVLIENSPTSTKNENLIDDFYNNVLSNDVYPRPVIELPFD